MTFVQAWRADLAASGTTISVTINPAAGNALVIWAAGEGTPVGDVTCADNATAVTDRPINASQNDDGFPVGITAFYRLNAPSGSRTLTVTFPTARTNRSLVVEEHSGLASYLGTNGINNQPTPTTAADATTSGLFNVTSAPAWLIGISLNWGAGAPVPAVGTGTNNAGQIFAYSGADYGRSGNRRVTATGNAALLFTAGANARHYTAALVFAETAGGGVDVTGVSTLRNTESATISGTGFGASQGAGTVTIGGVAQTVTAWNDTSITITVVRGTNPHGVDRTLTVTNNAAQSDNFTVQMLPQTGWSYVNLTAPLASSGNRITAIADLVAGDQLVWETVGGAVVASANGAFDADQAVTEFDVQAWDQADTTWSAVATQFVGNPLAVGRRLATGTGLTIVNASGQVLLV
jgi:hypothetical protein